MVWFRRQADQTADAPTVVLTHPTGVITMHDAEGRITDGRLELRGVIDDAAWERIRQHDIFGASSRSQSPGDLPTVGALRITLTTDAVLPEEAVDVPADLFVIVDAMRSVDLAELNAAGLEGEVWEGVHFSDPPAWSAAVAQLVTEGFEVLSRDEVSTQLQDDDDLVSIEFRYRSDVRLVQIMVSSPLALGDDVPLALYEAINGINSVVPWSTTTIDNGDVMVRETVPDEVVDQASLIIARVHDLLGLLWVARGPLAQVAQGALTPRASLEAMFEG